VRLAREPSITALGLTWSAPQVVGTVAVERLAEVREADDGPRSDRGDDAMMFEDRTQAGRALAAKLAPSIKPPCVVVAIPRGGVTVALPIVERLRVPLTVVYARKLTAPVAPEFAFGALDEDGQAIIDWSAVGLLGLAPDDVERAKTRVAAEIRRRMALYQVPALAQYLPGSGVVLVDDGLATGLTMRAALVYARRHGAREITVAVPCASAQAAALFRREADRFVSLVVDEAFMAVGGYYRDFSPVVDEEVTTMLARARELAQPPTATTALRLSFKNSRGLNLAGVLLAPDSPGPHPVVVFAHGLGSDKDSPRNRATAEALRAEGVAAFLFDFTGHGESEGKPQESTPVQQTDDLLSALDVVATLDSLDADRVGVAGASSGAAVALRVAAERPAVRSVVLRSGNPEGAEAAAERVKAPTLLIVGERDEPIRSANQDLLGRLAGPSRLEVVRRGDHLFEDPEALARAITLAVDWFKRHLSETTRTVPVGRPR
jgi:putative phosphoribosyl transferase